MGTAVHCSIACCRSMGQTLLAEGHKAHSICQATGLPPFPSLHVCLQGSMRRITLMNHIVTSMKMPQPADPTQQEPCSAAELASHILSTLHQLVHAYSMQGSQQGGCCKSLRQLRMYTAQPPETLPCHS